MFCRPVDQFPELDQLHLQGLGEPLLHPRFFHMVRYAARRGVGTSGVVTTWKPTTSWAARATTEGGGARELVSFTH
jgi:MoaA/NifB/PqqE/SkfB family radical SAM enzyme